MASDDDHVRLRIVVDGGRIAQASTTRVDPDGLERLVEGTIAAARLCPPIRRTRASPTPRPSSRSTTSTPTPRRRHPTRRAEIVADFVGAGPDLESAGLLLHRRRHPRAVLHHRAPLREPVDHGPGRRHPPRRGGRRAAHRRLRPDDLEAARRPRRPPDRRPGGGQGHRWRQPHRARPRHLRGGARGQGRGGDAAVPGVARLQRQGLRGGHELRPPRRAAVRRADPPVGRRHRPAAARTPLRRRGHPEAPRRPRPSRGHRGTRPRPAQRGAGGHRVHRQLRSARSPSVATPATCSSPAATSRSTSSSPASSGGCSSPTSGTTASSTRRRRSSPASPATACSSSRAAR